MSAYQQNSDEIWLDDHLDRRDEATYLSEYLAARYRVRSKEAGFVLALNGDWGMGKSFMIDRWSKEMRLAGHPVVSFNSWENDFTPEPLIAFIAELDEALAPYFKRIPLGQQLQKKWHAQIKAVLLPSLKVAGFALFKHAAGIGYEQFSELVQTIDDHGIEDDTTDEKTTKLDIKELGEKLEKVVDETLKSHNNTKKAIQSFKERLAQLIESLQRETCTQLPVCVFIDELDRCRPDYAIRLLEGIKHLFGVPGLHFIVATNLSELAHSVRAVYGSGFSADRYLKRFFDMEYSLPEPDGDKFAIELMTPLAEITKGHLITGLEHSLSLHALPAKGLPFIFFKYTVAFELPLRDQQQVARILEAALLSLGNEKIHIHFLMFLAALYQKNSQIYHQVAKAKNLSNGTNFPDLLPLNEKGLFSVRVADDSGKSKKVAAPEIARIYFDFLNNHRPHIRVDDDDFPDNLYKQIVRAKHSAEAINSYIEIIRRAGRFVQ